MEEKTINRLMSRVMKLTKRWKPYLPSTLVSVQYTTVFREIGPAAALFL